MTLRKEMFLAIIIGALFGVIAALLITQTPQKFLRQISKPSPVLKPQEQTPAPAREEKMTLEILLPEDQTLIQEKTIVVSGKTSPEATVIVTAPFDEKVIVAGADGAFSVEISLEEGANEIAIVSLANGEELEKSIVVNYTKEEI